MTAHDIPNYLCPKCGNTTCTVDEITTSGSGLTRFLDIQNRKFAAVTCENCRYTEFYRADTSALATIFDLFTS